MSAELPHLGTIWEASLDRRDFLRLLGAAAGTAALNCLPQSLSQGPSSKENLSQEEYFPSRTKLSEIVRWQEEGPSHLKEIEKGSCLFGEAVGKFSDGRLWLEEFLTGRIKEIDPPIALKEIIAFAGPGILSQISPNKEKLAFWLWDNKESLQTDFLVLLDLNSLSIRKVYERNQAVKIFPSVYRWSEDSRRLLCAFRTGWAETEVRIENNEVFIFEDEKLIYSQKGVLGHPGGISPDGEWVLLGTPTTSKNQSNYSLVNLESKKTISLFPIWGEGTLSVLWSPDSQSLVCGGEIFWPRDPQFTKFSLAPALIWVDLKNGTQENKRHLSSFYGLINLLHLSPDGDKILFSAYSDESHRKELLLFNFETGEMKSLVSHEWVGAFSNPDNFFFLSNEELLLVSYETSDLNIQTINLSTGQVNKLYKIKTTGFPLYPWWLDSNWLVYSRLFEGHPKDIRAFSLRSGKEFLLASLLPNNFNQWLTPLNEGQVVQADKRFYFSQGRKYLVTPQASEMLATVAPKPIPVRTAEQIPESVNKLELRGGDLLLGQEGGRWYLRDGKRYPVVDLGSFQNNVQFNRQRYEVPQVIFKRIPEGQDPLEGKPGFPDWDGHFVEAHREGSILLLFVKGWKSASDDGPSFPELKGGLRENNCSTDGRMAEFTYNTKRKPNGELELLPYDSTHAAVVPITPTKYLEWQLERYKKLLPWTKIILIAHSLGGWLAFNAALNQAEAVRAVITLDSPLKGINKTLIGDRGEAILRGLWGDEVVNFLIRMGDEVPEEAIERRAKMLQERGVEVFTFASTDDLLVPHQVAFLENRTQNLDGFSLNLRFPMGRLAGLDAPWINPFFTGDPREELKEWLNTVATAHGTVTRHPEVIKTIAKVVGKISS